MTTRLPAARFLSWVILAAILLTGSVGCGNKEIEELKSKVVQLQNELVDVQDKLADAEQELEAARAQIEKNDTKEEALVEQLTKVRVERDQFKQEITALKKRR